MRVRRVWFPVTFVVLGAIAAIIGIAFWRLDAFIAGNKAWIAQQAEAKLGRRVSFDTMNVSLRRGLGVRVTKLMVGDDPRFSKEDFLRVGEVQVRVKIWPALRGRFEVEEIHLVAPSVVLIRSDEGLNLASLGGERKP